MKNVSIVLRDYGNDIINRVCTLIKKPARTLAGDTFILLYSTKLGLNRGEVGWGSGT